MAVEFRTAVESDAPELATFAIAVFSETFGPHNTEGNMRQYLSMALTPAVIADQLRRSAGATILGIKDDTIKAYAMVLPDEPRVHDNIPPGSLFLQRFYLDSELHGSGVANELLDRVIDQAKLKNSDSLWLTVWEHNPRAIRFYEKRGFKTVGDCPFQFGDEQQRDLVMLRSW
ncbi:MAG: GNAT family N-acetyltransferase [Pseudomonadota bacterium]